VILQKIALQNGEEMAYREREGGERVIILIHGNMTSSQHWDVLIDALDPKYKVYAIDLRGFGASTYNKRITSIQDFSDDVKQFVDILRLKDFVMVGWSTGGAVAMQFQANYPGLCEKIVLLASASTRGYPMFASTSNGASETKRLTTLEEIEQDPKTIGMQSLYNEKNYEGLKSVWETVIYTDNKPDKERYQVYLGDMTTQRNLADVYHALNTFNISAKHNGVNEGTNEVAKIHIPVLILYGDRDYVVTKEMTDEIIEDLQGKAKVVVLEDTGHSPLIDNLALLKNEIETFIG